MDSPLLSVRQLNAEIVESDSPVLKNISFDLYPGKTLAIVGESGSGKSLTALSIPLLLSSGDIRYTSGEIYFRNKKEDRINLLNCSEKSLNQYRGNEIGLVFQEPMSSLNPLMTCGNQVIEAILQHTPLNKKQAKAKTIELFRQVELPQPETMIERYPHQLSGGQKQRVMIAMAMSCNPSLIIADEPTTALDVTVQKSILELLNKIRKDNGTALLFITHDLGIVEEMADDVAVMRDGEIKEFKPAKEIFQSPEHPYTKALLACRSTSFKKGQQLPTIDAILNETSEIEKGIASTKTFQSTQFTVDAAPLIAVKELSVSFSEKKWWKRDNNSAAPVVNRISFDIYKGETVGLVGESGCGKTTLGRTLLRLQHAYEGEINYEGKNILEMSGKSFNPYRKELQIVFQDPYASLNPRMRIGDILIEPLQLHRKELTAADAKKEMMYLLKKVGLPADSVNRYPYAFSGGQRQRVCIARALAVNPSFIVWDESVSALDASIQAQILNLINELKQEFMFTSLFISHDLSVVRYLCDRILVMKKGEIVEQGNAETIWENPAHPYTRELLSAIPGRKAVYKRE